MDEEQFNEEQADSSTTEEESYEQEDQQNTGVPMEQGEEKTLVGMSLSGVLVSSEPWKKAHEFGMKELANLTGDHSLIESTHSEEYFAKVEKALEKLYPELSAEARIRIRRRIYFERVLENIQNYSMSEKVGEFLEELDEDHRLAVVTTTPDEYTEEILELLGLDDYFDIEYCGDINEKDDKRALFKEFVEEHKPVMYIENGEKLKSLCEELGVKHVMMNTTENITGAEE